MNRKKVSLLTESEKTVEAVFMAEVVGSEARCVAHYLMRYGRIIDTDAAREFCSAYRKSPAGRTRWSRATYAPAKRLANRVYEYVLDSAAFWGRKATIVFTSGGSGSGKTTARSTISNDVFVSVPSPEEREIGVVVDGTLSNYNLAREQIGAALLLGHSVLVLHVMVDFENAVSRFIKRAKRVGRVVSLENLAMNHVEARNTFLKLYEELNEEVDFRVVDTSGIRAKLIDLTDFKARPNLAFDELYAAAWRVLARESSSLKKKHPKIVAALKQAGWRRKAVEG